MPRPVNEYSAFHHRPVYHHPQQTNLKAIAADRASLGDGDETSPAVVVAVVVVAAGQAKVSRTTCTTVTSGNTHNQCVVNVPEVALMGIAVGEGVDPRIRTHETKERLRDNWDVIWNLNL